MACGLIRRPVETFELFSIFSGYFLALSLVLGAGIEDAFNGEKEFGKVGGRPSGEARNKAFNHCSGFTS
jgi:hypothetical protein